MDFDKAFSQIIYSKISVHILKYKESKFYQYSDCVKNLSQ